MMYVAKLSEDGKAHFTEPFDTIEEARDAGKRRWHTVHFDVIEIDDQGAKDGVYEAIRYIPRDVT